MPMPKDGQPRRVYPKYLVCKWCKGSEHGKCPGCDCSQVHHDLALVIKEAA